MEATGGGAAGFDVAPGTIVGTVDGNSTTVILQGAQSCRLDGSAALAVVRWESLTSSTEIDFYFIFQANLTGLPTTDSELVRIADGSFNGQCYVFMSSSGNIKVINGAADSGYTVDAVSDDTPTHIWGHFKTDGTADIAFSTDGVRPTVGNKFESITGGTSSAINNFAFFADTAGDLIYDVDRLIVTSGSGRIGNNP